jgi:uncharacterized protein YndB with AHSA1/START domain
MTVNNATSNAATDAREGEVVITRIFDAPRELVWKAWTEPEHLRRWWGPKNFTSPACQIDLRVGGKYLYCMRSPEGQDFWSTGVYREIVPFEKLVCTDSFADENGNVVPATHYGMGADFPLEMEVTVTFEEQEGKTRMTLRHVGLPAGQMREMTGAGWNESFDKLAATVEKADGEKPGSKMRLIAEPGRQELIITRIFDAPRELVFKMFTDPNLIPHWWGPKRFTTTVDKMEVKAGGLWRFVQRDAEGNEFAFHGVYHAIEAPERLVYTFEFEGMPGHVSLETGTFEALNDGRTKLTGKSVFQSVAARDGMVQSGMEGGAAETMDRFAELLARN